jgi:choice-of-anchor A domain-containing protein
VASTTLLALATASAARADTMLDYNLFSLGDVSAKSGDIEGRVAVGGNASFQSFSIGGSAPSASPNLVVAGDLKAKWGSTNGLTIVGGKSHYIGWSTAGLQPDGTSVPVDFVAAATFLKERAVTLSTLPTSGVITSLHGQSQWVLNGASSGLSVFNLSAPAIAKSNSFTINLAPGTQALINVTGDAGKLTGGLVINGGRATDVLWNFYDASTLSFASISMLGSVLAPNADYQGGWGQMHGTLMVKSFSDRLGSTELHNDARYAGNLLDAPVQGAVPEPATWAMMIAGFGIVGAALRRRAAVVQPGPAATA